MDSYIQYCSFGSLAVITNCIVIFVLLRNPKCLKKSSFIFGLSVGDIVDGIALVTVGANRIVRLLDGSITNLVHPRYCMIIFITPVFLLGNQIPGFMFFLVGLERFLAVGSFDWYYARWSNKLAWIMTAAVYGCCFMSVAVAYGVVFSFGNNVTVAISCGTGSVIGTGYSIYNYGVSIVGGAVAVVATVVAMINLTKRKRQLTTATVSYSMKNHVKKQWHMTRVMLCLAVLDFALVVVPNVLVTLANGFKVAALSGVLAWSLQIVSLRSSLNIFIYLIVNLEFRQAALKAFGLEKRATVSPSFIPQESRSINKPNYSSTLY